MEANVCERSSVEHLQRVRGSTYRNTGTGAVDGTVLALHNDLVADTDGGDVRVCTALGAVREVRTRMCKQHVSSVR